MLEVRELKVELGKRMVLRNIELEVARGELLGLLGPNGAGKSTLLRSILQLVPARTGTITLGGRPVAAIPTEARAREIAYLAQQGPIHWPLSVERLVALGRFPHLSSWQQLSTKDQEMVENILRRTDLLELRQRAVTTLSGGERTRVLLARALSVDAALLLADEPVAALDPAHQLQIMELLRDYCEAGHAAVVVMHDLTLAARYCHRLALIHQGNLIAAGNAREVLKREHLATVYNIEAQYGSDEAYFIIPQRRIRNQ